MPAPARLTPYLTFRRFPPAALDVARRVLDDDDEFRGRVADVVTEEEVGPAGLLFLRRPEGWEQELEQRGRQVESAREEREEQRRERRATRQLARTQDVLSQVRSEQQAATDRAERARAELADEREHRAKAERRVEELERALEQSQEQRAAAVRELKAAEARLVARAAEIRALRDQVDRLERQVAQPVEPAPPAAVSPAPAGSGSRPDDAAGARLDRAAHAVERAALAAADLAGALGEVASSLQEADRSVPVTPAEPVAVAGPEAGPGSGPSSPAPPRRRRRPMPTPPGLFDDAPAAAAAWLGTPGVVVLVDGYNVSLTGWADLELHLQRDRLVDALSARAASWDARVVVVFDGAVPAGQLPPESRLRGVQVRFSPPGVEADDVIIATVEQLPVDQPVVVVSSDHRVQAGARRAGANVVRAAQLLALLR